MEATRNLNAFVMSRFLSRGNTEGNALRQNIQDWFNEYTGKHVGVSEEAINNRAQELYREATDRNLFRLGNKRFSFAPTTPKEALIKGIFETAFKTDRNRLIELAEKASPQQGSFYPLWKRVCLINTPKTMGSLIGNTAVKFALSAIALYYAVRTCYRAYDMTAELIAKTSIVVINNTPLVVIQAINGIVVIRKMLFVTLCCCWLARKFILCLPEIPYVTPAVRALDPWHVLKLIGFGEHLFTFICERGFECAKFTSNTCSEVSGFLNRISSKADQERLEVGHQKAFDVWKAANLQAAAA